MSTKIINNLSPKLRPIVQALKESIKIWWDNFDKFLRILILGISFSLIPIVVVLILNEFLLVNWLWLNMLAGIISVYFYIRTFMSIFILIKKNYKGEALDIFKSTIKPFWPYLGLSLLSSLFIMLWSLLLIVPAIIFSVYYSLVPYVFFFENKHGLAAIRRSVRLIKGNWWRVLGRILFLYLIIFGFIYIISWPIYLFTEHSLAYSIWTVLIEIITLVISPIFIIYMYKIYKDLSKIRKHKTLNK